MAELEPGHPDELTKILANWLNLANEPNADLLPAGIDPTQWAVRQFIRHWQADAESAIEKVERSLESAKQLCESDATCEAIIDEIDLARQFLQEDLRDHLGLYGQGKTDN